MSRGKYSLAAIPTYLEGYVFNCFGKVPAEYVIGVSVWHEQYHFGNYDRDGFDSYGYSAFDKDGNYVFGEGVDRAGWTEIDYLTYKDDPSNVDAWF